MPFKYPSMQERILANSIAADDNWYNGTPCWWWIGARCGAPGAKQLLYGKISIRSSRTKRGKRKVKYKLAHRVSREAFKGEFFRRGQVARHMCPPHPYRTLCCNPDHIVPGTQRENVHDTLRERRERRNKIQQQTAA